MHIYCGDGKGKTTAAAGLALRCCGAGKRVLFFQFLKDGSSAEISMLKKVGVDVLCGDKYAKFTFLMTDEEKSAAKAFYNDKLEHILKIMSKYDMIVLDEVFLAINVGFVSEEKIIPMFFENKETVLTGRNPSERLISLADYVSEIKKIKHPFDKGVCARKGIEM